MSPLLLLACSNGPQDDVVRLSWTEGQRWHLGVSTRDDTVGSNSTGGLLTADIDPNAEMWSDEVIWTYQVVENHFVPEPSDELYAFALDSAGEERPLTVVRAEATPALNPGLAEDEPVVYLVFRSGGQRLAGLVEFRTVDGERVSTALKSSELEGSLNALSQGRVSSAMTYLAPLGARWQDGERTLEDGSLVTSVAVDADTTDVLFDDRLGGDLVATRYQKGQPWPTWTMTSNVEARLLDDAELPELRGDASLPEQLDFRTALATAINLDDSFALSPELLESGELKIAARPEGRPWAGYWWPQSSGKLVMGTAFPEKTYTGRIKLQVDPLLKQMETQRESDPEAWRESRRELIDLMLEFYEGMGRDLDNGKLRIEDGRLVGDIDGETWDYDINTLSPMDKWALFEHLRGSSDQALLLPAWELLNHYSPEGGSWWGHCNGWAAAAILTNEPREEVVATVQGHEFTFHTKDIKGLLSESHYGVQSRFYGTRYNGPEDDVSDLTPADFHRISTLMMGEMGVPVVFDTTATEQVWNFPAWRVTFYANETTPERPSLVDLNRASYTELTAVPGLTPEMASTILDHRQRTGAFQSMDEVAAIIDVEPIAEHVSIGGAETERTFAVVAMVDLTTDNVQPHYIAVSTESPASLHETWGYTLRTDANGTVLGGTWDDNEEHPDFAWVPTLNPHLADSRGSENPFLVYGDLLDVMGRDLER